jgi:hypothetical protein
MPNSKAKQRKRKKALLNKKWSVEGITAAQHKKWVSKQQEQKSSLPIYGVRV